jgi:hypothetical protein
MQQLSYENFIQSFVEVNPFQLAHFGEVVIVQLEDILADRALREVLQFSLQDINLALIGTMRVLQIEIAEQRMSEAQYQLQHTRLQTHALLPNMVAAE